MTISSPPEPQISIGQLRQNPTEMIRRVHDGERYVLTDRGQPVARIIPFDRNAWVSAERAGAAFIHPVGTAWGDDLQDDRDASDMRDPFAR